MWKKNIYWKISLILQVRYVRQSIWQLGLLYIYKYISLVATNAGIW